LEAWSIPAVTFHTLIRDNLVPDITTMWINGIELNISDRIQLDGYYDFDITFEVVDTGVGVGSVWFYNDYTLDKTPIYLSQVAGTNNWTATINRNNPALGDTWRPALLSLGSVVLMKACAEDLIGLQALDDYSWEVELVDNTAPSVDITALLQLANTVLPAGETIPIHLTVPSGPGESGIRNVILFYSTSDLGSNLTDWQDADSITFIRVSGNDWLGVLPAQNGSTKLYWAIYVRDYFGNSNEAALLKSTPLNFGADSRDLEIYVGFAFIGLLAFGILFSISYRIQQGVKSITKAKKVTAAVKKAPAPKSLSPGKKMPISSDIQTKVCPICKAKIGADATECPYCHKKF
jgi:hypothetical protein